MPAAISLEWVSFGVSLPDVQLEHGWPTRESSQIEVAFMNEFFHVQLKKKAVFDRIKMPWGVAWSSFDEKGFCASSGLRYKR